MIDKIDHINSLPYNERVNYVNVLIDLVNEYLINNSKDEPLGVKLVKCIVGVRASELINSEVDMKLIDASLKIARNFTNNRELLIQLLNSALYYSSFYPVKYNRNELESEIQKLSN